MDSLGDRLALRRECPGTLKDRLTLDASTWTPDHGSMRQRADRCPAGAAGQTADQKTAPGQRGDGHACRRPDRAPAQGALLGPVHVRTTDQKQRANDWKQNETHDGLALPDESSVLSGW